jgi:hypothetical protein
MEVTTLLHQHLSPRECAHLINEFNKHRHTRSPGQATYLIDATYNGKLLIDDDGIISKVLADINWHRDDNYEIDWAQIVNFKSGSTIPYHTDHASESTRLTSITYLNEGFVGGSTHFTTGLDVVPKMGTTLIFNGKAFKHCVMPVEGDRMTLNVWYK